MRSQYTKDTLELLLDRVPDYIFYRDLMGRNIYCNEGYAKDFIGKSKDEIYGKTYEELDVLKPYFNVARIKDSEVIEKKKPLQYTQTIYLDGVKYTVNIEKYPTFDEDGNIDGILGRIRKISHAEELDKLKEGFFSNIRHEFRTPINMIMSSIQLLENRCEYCGLGDCKDCFIRDIHRIKLNTLRILKISNNFIDLTGLQAGNIEYSPDNYDIVECVESVCNDINNYKKFKNITIIFDTEIEELIISFDKVKLERVLLNLISNAIKFNHKDGTVIVSIIVEGDFVGISVKDTGIGIKEKDLENIFNEFYNVEDRLVKSCEGLGIGLKLTKHLVEMHKGFISVKSSLGKGSEFVVRLPKTIEERVNNVLDKIYYNRLEKIKIEFSDIYE